MDANTVISVSERIEYELYRSDPRWWREVIDPLQEAFDLADGKPAWPRSG